MAPNARTGASRAAASQSTDQTLPPPDLQEELSNAQAEIETLRAQLAAQTPLDRSPDREGLVTVLESLRQHLGRSSSPLDRPQRSAKVADPPVLTNGTDPTFDNWRL